MAMDMWQGNINALRNWLSHAAIIFDSFHIVQNYSKIIAQVRLKAGRPMRISATCTCSRTS